jgi:carboxynorspermidine decarboxylase
MIGAKLMLTGAWKARASSTWNSSTPIPSWNHQFDEILSLAHHVTFNSLAQWDLFRDRAPAGRVSFGLRINPGYSEVATAIYNPCRPGSRFGVTADHLAGLAPDGLEGVHFHSLCEQNSDALERTLRVVERDFADWLHACRWLNMGGGHHITRPDYDMDRLCRCIEHMQAAYNLEVILEPGEAVALQAGYLVSSVLDPFTYTARRAYLPGRRCDRGLFFFPRAPGGRCPGVR